MAVIFYIAAGVLLALKIAGLADAVSWWLIVGIALVPLAFGMIVVIMSDTEALKTVGAWTLFTSFVAVAAWSILHTGPVYQRCDAELELPLFTDAYPNAREKFASSTLEIGPACSHSDSIIG